MEFFTISVPIVTYDILENIDAYNDFIEVLTRSKSIAVDKKKRRMLKSRSQPS